MCYPPECHGRGAPKHLGAEQVMSSETAVTKLRSFQLSVLVL